MSSSSANQAGREQLLNALAEQMKLPLLQIARSAELAKQNGIDPLVLENIESTADSALRLIDSYLLSTKLFEAQNDLKLEPVSVSAVLHDTAHELFRLAKQNDCELQLHLAGRYEPIMAHRGGLQAALTSLGYVFIESQSADGNQTKPVVKLAAHRSKAGIVTGMFTNTSGLSADMYRRARTLRGRARQPLAQFSASSGAGVYLAESLFSSMSSKLRIAHHQKLSGLAATFSPSRQLSMV